ncbi:MAG: hypothetical protein WD895_03835 [Acidimicrobiia bacterium]
MRGPLVATAMFVTILLAGGLIWLAAAPGTQPAATGPLDTLEWDLWVSFPAPQDVDAFLSGVDAIPGVSVVQYFPDESALYPDRQTGDQEATDDVVATTTNSAGSATFEEGQAPLTAALLLRLDRVASAEDTAARINQDFTIYTVGYSPVIAAGMADAYFEWAAQDATVLGEDPLVLQPSAGPEPRFDTSSLGTEIVLIPAATADDIPSNFWNRSEPPEGLDDYALSASRPVLHIGYLAEIDSRLVVYGTDPSGRCTAVVDPGGSGGGCGGFDSYSHGAQGFGGIEGEVGYANVDVPRDSAVVTMTIDGGAPMWQRPVAGFAMFPALVATGLPFIAEAYDASGTIIGHWESLS